MTQHDHQRPRNRATDSSLFEQQLAPGKRTLTEAEIAPLLQQLLASVRDQPSKAATQTTSSDPWQGLDEISAPPGSTAETFRSVLEHMRVADTGKTPVPATARGKKPIDELLFIGMGAGADKEIAALAAQADIVAVTNAKDSDTQSENGSTFDLADDTGVRDFLGALNVAGAVVENLVKMFDGVEPGTRDELGQIVRIYNEAEKGQRNIERVVLSGHGDGEACWGVYGKGKLYVATLVELAALFPSAAGQVRDLMFSGCQTGYEKTMDIYRQAFPKLESIWAYAGTSPATDSGAIGHIKIWETATEGKSVPDMKAARDAVKDSNHGDEVATWTKNESYVGGNPMTIDEAVDAANAANATHEAAFNGSLVVTDPGSGPLFEYYNLIQRVLGHRDSDQIDKVKWGRTRDVTLRLRHFLKKVLPKIIEEKGAALDAGYAAAGLTQPNWATATRAVAFAEAGRFHPSVAKASGDAKPKVEEAFSILFNGVRELWADYVSNDMAD